MEPAVALDDCAIPPSNPLLDCSPATGVKQTHCDPAQLYRKKTLTDDRLASDALPLRCEDEVRGDSPG
jgi:hypothetical protein